LGVVLLKDAEKKYYSQSGGLPAVINASACGLNSGGAETSDKIGACFA